MIIRAENIAKTFRSGRQEIPVLRRLSLAIETGETVSIQGSSGSGKSTLLNILAGLEKADEGRLHWRGEEISKLALRKLAGRRARYLGMVFQHFYLIPELDARANVLMASRILGKPGSTERQRADYLLDAVGLGERLDSDVTELSGGERQRVAIARALMNRPALILADEPTGNLDEHTAGRVMDLLFDVVAQEQASLLLVTHDSGFAGQAQRSHLLHEGQLE